MVERTSCGYHLSGDDASEFYRRLYNPTKEEINNMNSYFNKLENTIYIVPLNNMDFIVEIK